MNSKNLLHSTFVKNRYWVYIFPFLMDFSVGAILFLMVLKAIWMGASAFNIGILGSLWGLTYFISCLCLSFFATEHNSRKYMTIGAISFIFISVFLIFSKSLSLLFIAAILCGFATSFFFIAFQLFMRKITGHSIGKATGIYTLSWSFGLALGVLSQGFIASLNPIVSILPIIICSSFIITGLYISERILKNPGEVKNMENLVVLNKNKSFTEENFNYSYIFIGWMNIFMGALLGGGFRFIIPKLVISHFNFSSSESGAMVFLFLGAQGITGFYLIKFSKIWYKISYDLLIKSIFIFSSLLMILFPDVTILLMFTLIGGIYSGYSFYSAAFYSLNHEKSGRNISINESFVGMASMIGPIIYGYMLEKNYRYFFSTTIVFILILIFMGFLFIKKSAKSAPR
ncbi:MAG: MFS transporter [Candidatus Omnitrophica bacterium]|nr:MFS transporter [Candidatus Omnitrophota bacterium]